MIIISPFAKFMRNGAEHPKNYPYWPEVIEGLKHHQLIQIGITGEKQLLEDFRQNLSLDQLKTLVLASQTWIAVDSFFQHFCWDIGKQGVVLWGQSDPNIFGHPENINLLKDRKYLRANQFWWWEQCEYKKEAFVEPEIVVNAVESLISQQK